MPIIRQFTCNRTVHASNSCLSDWMAENHHLRPVQKTSGYNPVIRELGRRVLKKLKFPFSFFFDNFFIFFPNYLLTLHCPTLSVVTIVLLVFNK